MNLYSLAKKAVWPMFVALIVGLGLLIGMKLDVVPTQNIWLTLTAILLIWGSAAFAAAFGVLVGTTYQR